LADSSLLITAWNKPLIAYYFYISHRLDIT
jgi:hypothetical protein